jgi:hypothetical protein
MDNLPDRETQRIAFYRRAPLAELLAVLIRQFRAPLLRAGVPGEALSDAAAQAAAEAAIARQHVLALGQQPCRRCWPRASTCWRHGG